MFALQRCFSLNLLTQYEFVGSSETLPKPKLDRIDTKKKHRESIKDCSAFFVHCLEAPVRRFDVVGGELILFTVYPLSENKLQENESEEVIKKYKNVKLTLFVSFIHELN